MKLRILIIIPIMLFQSCASIVSRTAWPVTITSTPDKASFVIKNRDGVEVSRGTTPAAVNLKSGDGFFKRGKYTVTLSSEGYAPVDISVKAKMNGWYLGNLVFAGWVGLLIVDPITGAMYKIKDPKINQTLAPATSAIPVLNIIDIADVPVTYRNQLIKVK